MYKVFDGESESAPSETSTEKTCMLYEGCMRELRATVSGWNRLNL
jgi:hypothetical protein